MQTFEFNPKTCQWINEGNIDGDCRLPCVVGKSYCEGHFHQAYQTKTPSDKELDKAVEAELKQLVDPASPIIEE